MKNTFLLLLFLFSINSFSQIKEYNVWQDYVKSDSEKLELVELQSLNYEKAYRIWNDYQVIELFKINENEYSGSLINFVTKVKRKNKIIQEKIILSKEIVEKLIEKLTEENIETLKDCKEVEGYVNGLDGTTYIFEIGLKKEKRFYTYWEPENTQYQNENIKEVKNVRNILNAINSEYNLWNSFENFRNKLPKGKYSYGMIMMTKK